MRLLFLPQEEDGFNDASYVDNTIENDGEINDNSDPDLDLKLPVKQIIDEIQGLKPLNLVPIVFSNGNPLIAPQESGIKLRLNALLRKDLKYL